MGDTGRLIVGLGNPGSKYKLTRHNAGFLALDYFAEQHGFAMTSEKWQGEYCRERLSGISILLIKPLTFMNKSGECVTRFADYYKIVPSKILVIHDDLDLPAGRIKVVARGGAGGHNGIRSIINHLGTSDFARLKLGIGRPASNGQGQGITAERYVLARFGDQELDIVNEQLSLADEAVELFIEKGIDVCMNRINGR